MSGRISHRLNKALGRLMPERLVFLRSDTETRFLRLTPSAQVMVLAGSALAVALLVVGKEVALPSILPHLGGGPDVQRPAVPGTGHRIQRRPGLPGAGSAADPATWGDLPCPFRDRHVRCRPRAGRRQRMGSGLPWPGFVVLIGGMLLHRAAVARPGVYPPGYLRAGTFVSYLRDQRHIPPRVS